MNLRRITDGEPIESHFSPKLWTTCTIKILVVTDDGIVGGFGPTESLHLGLALQVLATSASPHAILEFTTAHRQDEETATLRAFRFTQIDLSAFSQIWLFGLLGEEEALDANERDALARFMEAGGGVFATGDHESMGKAMAAGLPRVGSMRRWHYPNPGPHGEPVAPSRYDLKRHNTIADPVPSTPANEGTEKDTFPQTLRLRLYTRTIGSGILQRVASTPHPVLCGPDGPIRYLPDHMHEGTCEVPAHLDRTFTLDGEAHAEYPAGADGVLVAPEVIAWSASTETTDTEFGALCAYDGAAASVGRVLVDATWHHWFNDNIRSLIKASDPSDPAYDPAVVPKWNAIAAYYRNIPLWLADERTRNGLRAATWLNLLAYPPIYISTRTPDVDDRVTYFFQLGLFARDALTRLAPPCQVDIWIADAIDWIGLTLDPWAPPDADRRAAPAWLDLPAFETVALGGVVDRVAAVARDMPRRLSPDDAETVHAAARQGAAFATAAYFERYVASADHARQFAERAKAFLLA